jgi:hypothetical protein
VRYVDDYLILSTRKHVAEKFLIEMQKGFAEYCCFVNPNKTIVNFEFGEFEIQPGAYETSLNLIMTVSNFTSRPTLVWLNY